MGEFVTGWSDIANVFSVSQRAVRDWRMAGAPILCLGDRPVTRLADLWQWLVANRYAIEQGGVSAADAKRVAGAGGLVGLGAAVKR